MSTMKVMEKFEAQLQVTLTREEHLDRARQLGIQIGDLKVEQDRAKALKQELKEREETMQAEVIRLSSVCRDGSEPRPVRVERCIDFARKTVFDIRLDTGEVVPNSERKAKAEELQLDLEDAAAPSVRQ